MASGGGSYTFKIVLLGEGCVGKTSCVLRYVEDKFNDKHITTLQVWNGFQNVEWKDFDFYVNFSLST